MFSYSWIVSSDIQKKPLHFKKSLVIHAKVCLSTRDSVVHGYSCFSGRPGSLMSPACPSSVYLTPGSVLRGHGLPLFHEHKAAMTTCSCRINPFFRLSAALIQKLKGQIIPTGYTCAQLRRLVLLVSLVTSRLYMLKKKKHHLMFLSPWLESTCGKFYWIWFGLNPIPKFHFGNNMTAVYACLSQKNPYIFFQNAFLEG